MFSVILSFHPTPSQEILPLTRINSSLQKASPKTGRFSLNGPRTRQQSYIYEQSLQLIQSCIVHHFSARILTFQNQEYTSVRGTQRHKGFGLLTYFSILFQGHQGIKDNSYTTAVGTWHLPLSGRQGFHTLLQHTQGVYACNTAAPCVALPVLRGNISHKNRLSFVFPRMPCSPRDWLHIDEFLGITHTGMLVSLHKVSLCLSFLHVSCAFLYPITCLSAKGR